MKDYIKRTIEFYDKNLEKYIEETRNLQDTAWLKKFVSLLPERARVLDLGCAFGRDCKYFVEQGFETHGVDLSTKMIERASALVKRANFYVMDILDLEFDEDYFDGIWCSATLLHLTKADVLKALKEICRVLKKGGILYLHLKEGEGEKFVTDKRYGNARKFYSYFKEKEIRNLLIENKFKMIDLKLVFDKEPYRYSGTIYLLAKKT